jgi:cellulose biosynthesis protein BcsQ
MKDLDKKISTEIISFFSSKGGSTKTTMAINTATLLADMGFNVLLVDTDKQNSLSKLLEIEQTQTLMESLIKETDQDRIEDLSKKINEIEKRLTHLEDVLENPDLLNNKDKSFLAKVASKNGIDSLWLMPNRKDYNKIESICSKTWFRAFKKLFSHNFFKQFNYIIIDTQGSSGTVQGAVCHASSKVICPIVPKPVDVEALFDDTSAALDLLIESKSEGLTKAEIFTFFCLVDRGKTSQEIIRLTIPYLFNKNYNHLKTYIPDSNKVLDASAKKIPAHQYDYKSADNKLSLCDYMHLFIWELLPELCTDQMIFAANSLLGSIDPIKIKSKYKLLLELGNKQGGNNE